MKRRGFLAASAATVLARPAIAQAAKPLIFVPQANLTSLDPIWTTATVTRNYAFLVFETLYGLDSRLDPHPQMVEGHVVDDGARPEEAVLRVALRLGPHAAQPTGHHAGPHRRHRPVQADPTGRWQRPVPIRAVGVCFRQPGRLLQSGRLFAADGNPRLHRRRQARFGRAYRVAYRA